MKVGLFGGTFDPIHRGHLDVVRAAQRALELQCVWIVPARQPPHRRSPGASAAHRFAMVSLAVADLDGVCASDLEMERPGPSYTVETLAAARERLPPGAALYFIIGADAFADVPTWRAFPAVLDAATFVVISRPGRSVATLPEVMPALADRMRRPGDVPPTNGPGIILVDTPTAAVSSSEIRERIAQRRALDDVMPRAVAAHILKHDLYRARENDSA